MLVASRDGYRRLCRLITRAKTAGGEGRGRRSRSRISTGRRPGWSRSWAARRSTPTHYGVGGLLDRVLGRVRRGQRLRRAPAALPARPGIGQPGAGGPGRARIACRWWPPTASGSRRRRRGRCSTCSPARVTGRRVERAGTRLAWNAERFLKPPAAMAGLFADLPQAVAATRALADRLQYTMADLGYRFPDYPVPEGETQASFLRHITEAGARDRYRPYHDRARAQVARELDLIEKLRLAGYFLIVWDIVNFCRQHGILVQGRGSAANSAVCYSLGHHGGRSGGHGPAVRAVPLGGARRVAGHRSRPAQRRSARAGDSVRLPALRRARRGDDGQRHHLPRAQRGARGGQGARARRGAGGSAGQGDGAVRVARPGGVAGAAARGRGPRRPATRASWRSRTCGAASRTCRGTSASTRAAW